MLPNHPENSYCVTTRSPHDVITTDPGIDGRAVADEWHV